MGPLATQFRGDIASPRPKMKVVDSPPGTERGRNSLNYTGIGVFLFDAL
jgi:hypothetical protein